MSASDGRLDLERGTGVVGAARIGPTRRTVIGGGVAVGALAWAAPTIVSVPAASAATIPPPTPLTIDEFTDIQNANTTLNSNSFTTFVGSRTLSSTAGVTLFVQSGVANYFGGSGPPGSQGEIRYNFDTNGFTSIDLSGITSIGGSATASGSPNLVLSIVDINNDSVSLAPTTTSPVLAVPLGAPPIDLTQVIRIVLRFNGSFVYQLSELIGT